MPIYIAYSHISSEGPNGKAVLDADTDREVLRKRLNAYMATPRMIDYNRGSKQEIAEGKTQSPTYYGSGGGCSYTTWLSIEEVKPLITE